MLLFWGVFFRTRTIASIFEIGAAVVAEFQFRLRSIQPQVQPNCRLFVDRRRACKVTVGPSFLGLFAFVVRRRWNFWRVVPRRMVRSMTSKDSDSVSLYTSLFFSSSRFVWLLQSVL